MKDVKESQWFSLHVDEANKMNRYLGIVVRYLPKDSMEVKVACVDVRSLSSSNAATIAKTITDSVKDLNLQPEHCLSIMTDSCNTMRGAHRRLHCRASLSYVYMCYTFSGVNNGVVVTLEREFENLIDIGGCSLHHIHNVSKHACCAADSKVESLVRMIYCHFKYSLDEREELDMVS